MADENLNPGLPPYAGAAPPPQTGEGWRQFLNKPPAELVATGSQTQTGAQQIVPPSIKDQPNAPDRISTGPGPVAPTHGQNFQANTEGFPIRKSQAHAFDANGKDIHVGMRVALIGYVTKVDPAAAHFDDVEVTLDHPNPHAQHKTKIKVDPSQLEVL